MSSVPQYLGQSSGNTAPSWLTAAQQWYNSGNRGSGSYLDQSSGMQISPMFNTTYEGNGQDRNAINSLIGWKATKGNVGDAFTGYDLEGNPMDATQGGLYGATVADTSDTFLDKLIQGGVLAGAGYGAGNLMGLWGAGAGTGTATGAATGSGGSALNKAVLDGTNVFGANSTAGALDISALSNASPGLSAQTAMGQIGTDIATGVTTPVIGAPVTAPVTSPAVPTTGPTAPVLGPGFPATTPGINLPTATLPGVTTTRPGGTSTGGLDLGSIIAGLLSGYQNNQNSKDILGYLDKQQADIDKLYAPGSPEYDYLMKQIERKDAASGRNSQYGPRSVELAAKIAQIKAEQKARLAIGGSQFAVPAIQQGNSTLNGLLAALGGASSAGYTIPQVINNVSSIIGSLFGDK